MNPAPNRQARSKTCSADYGHGVSVSLLPNAAGHYVIRWTEAGERRSTKRLKFAAAHQLAQQLVQESIESGGGLRLVPTEGTALTIVDEYLASPAFKALVDRTQKQRRAFLTGRFAPHALRHPVTEWNRAVETTLETSVGDGLAPATVHRHYAELRAVGQWAVAEGLLPPECTRYRFKKPRKARRDVDDLPTQQQVEAVAAALAPDCDPLIVLIAAYCGPRIGELLALTVRDFDFPDHKIHINKQIDADDRAVERVKSGHARTTTLHEFLEDEIRVLVLKAAARGGRDARVFPYGRHQFERQWTRACAAVGRTPGGTGTFRWRFHDLRHFFCSWALSMDGLKLDVADVAALAGHHSPEFTYRTYVKSRPGLHERVRQAGLRVARSALST